MAPARRSSRTSFESAQNFSSGSTAFAVFAVGGGRTAFPALAAGRPLAIEGATATALVALADGSTDGAGAIVGADVVAAAATTLTLEDGVATADTGDPLESSRRSTKVVTAAAVTATAAAAAAM